jgi:hypothetical protein
MSIVAEAEYTLPGIPMGFIWMEQSGVGTMSIAPAGRRWEGRPPEALEARSSARLAAMAMTSTLGINRRTDCLSSRILEKQNWLRSLAERVARLRRARRRGFELLHIMIWTDQDRVRGNVHPNILESLMSSSVGAFVTRNFHFSQNKSCTLSTKCAAKRADCTRHSKDPKN